LGQGLLNRTVWIILLFAFVTKTYSQQTTIFDSHADYSGTVSKITDNSPLDSVEISVEHYGIVGYSSKDGSFRVKAPVNISRLIFKKDGYIGAQRIIVPGPEPKSSLDISLFPEFPNEDEQKLILKNYKLTSFNDLSGESLKKEESLLKSLQKTEVPSVIRVLMPDNMVVVMNMDEYLKGVVPSEVPASWDMNALKAQAIAARSYASVNFKHNSQGADVCTNTHCQAWKPAHYDRTNLAVMETSNFSVIYQGTIINALFFSHCNGTTRNNENVWGGTPVPYLRSKNCPCGYTAHNAHGVGMCQYGSRTMALRDSSWESILTWYYSGAAVDKTPLIRGTLKGVIYHGSDNSNLNNRITGAIVKLSTGEEIQSGENGVYSFDLAPAQYTVTVSKSGFRAASLTREVTSGNTIWGSIELVHNVGINPNYGNKRWLYPNPAKDYVIVETENDIQLTITNLSGRRVWSGIISEKTVLNTSNFMPGVYIVVISGKEHALTEKLVITN
jgi:hypothetical protein